MGYLLVKAKAVDLHTPKTGGMWRKKVYDSLGIEVKLVGGDKTSFATHSPFWDIPTRGIDYVFGWARNPLTLLESFWRYCAHRWDRWPDTDDKWRPFEPLLRVRSNDFNEWVQAVEHHSPGCVTRMMEHFVGPEGGHAVDRICFFENLVQETADVLNQLGYKVKPEQLQEITRNNKPVNMHVTWDPEVRAYVIDREYEALERFEYISADLPRNSVRADGFDVLEGRVGIHVRHGEFAAAIDILEMARKTYSMSPTRQMRLVDLNAKYLGETVCARLAERGIVTVGDFLDTHRDTIVQVKGLTGYNYKEICNTLNKKLAEEKAIIKRRPQRMR